MSISREQFLYSWKGDFYRHLTCVHHLIVDSPERVSKWETVWRPLIKEFLTPLITGHDIHYLNLFSMHNPWTNLIEESNLPLEKDFVYFGLKADIMNTNLCRNIASIECTLENFNIPPVYDILDLHALILLLVPLRLYGIKILTHFILNELSPNLNYWKDFQNSIFNRSMHFISYIPSLLFNHIIATKNIEYNPKQRFKQLCEHNHMLTKMLGQWIKLFSEEDLEHPRYEPILKILTSASRIIDQFQADNETETRDISISFEFTRCIRALSRFDFNKKGIIKSLSRPSWLIRSWFPLTLTCFCVYKFVKFCGLHGNWILISMYEAKITLTSFLKYWIKDPLLDVWHTIRYEGPKINNHKNFSISQADSLKSDLDSLERMLVQFSKEHPELLEPTLREIPVHTNMNIVLKHYEQELISPIKNAIMGDLIRLILIQVQKSKVDLQLALHSVDRLLKSNELNFAFLAVFPTLLIVYLVFFKIKAWHRSWMGASKYQLINNIERHVYHLGIYANSKNEYDLGALILTATRLYHDASLLLTNEYTKKIDAVYFVDHWNGFDMELLAEQRYVIWILCDLSLILRDNSSITLERMNRSLQYIKSL